MIGCSIEKQLKKSIKVVECPLVDGYSPVDGAGPNRPRYLVVGEAPGADEVRVGIPFIGKSGKKLNELLLTSGIDLGSVYYTNAVKCRPPNNATPNKLTRQCCRWRLLDEIDMLQPEMVITIGAVPLSLLTSVVLGDVHGSMIEVVVEGRKVIIIPMYHPSAGFRNSRINGQLVDDFRNMPTRISRPSGVEVTFVGADEGWTFKTSGVIAVDTEVDPETNKLLCISAAGGGDKAVTIVNTIGDFALGVGCHFVFQNAKFDLKYINNFGADVDDTMVAAYTLGYKQLGLHYLASRLLGVNLQHWNEAKTIEDMGNICGTHAAATWQLWEYLEPSLGGLYYDIEKPLIKVLFNMEKRGVKIDIPLIEEIRDGIEEELQQIHFDFNPNSNVDVIKYIYEELGVPIRKRTDGGQPSVDKGVLEAVDDDVVRRLLRYRGLNKELGTYVESYLGKVDEHQRLHANYKQTSTRTNRLSCADPNLQNVSREGLLRRAFIAGEGRRLLKGDYSQLELRVFAALNPDGHMYEVFQQGRDIHAETMAAVGVDRHLAKIFNFKILYLGDKRAVYYEYGDAGLVYLERYPEIERYWYKQRNLALDAKEVVTYHGFRRSLDEMWSDDYREREKGIREAINTPIQGTASEVVKKGMLRCTYPMIAQVHDELLVEVDEGVDVRSFKEQLEGEEINGMTFPVEMMVGKNWKDMEEVEDLLV